ncbi:MAG TPA: glycoside hydrolase family 75 protein [Thermoanaerobaculia bacterium]|nr:glycoside hydrolase family 75 protein [Thermoanaerobaculia bacterium]
MSRTGLATLICLLLSFIATSPAAAASCEAVIWREYRGTKLWKLPESDAYFYVVNRISIDADGAPNAYAPGNRGIDDLRNAGFPNGAWRSILVVDPQHPDRPFVQPDGETAGFFISMTTLQDLTLPVTDVHRYVDATRIPYLVFPGAFWALPGTGDFGDLTVARHIQSGKESSAVVADKGPRNASLGEISIRLAENLGGRNVSPRHGTDLQGPFLYVVFPKSKAQPRWPLTVEQIQERAQSLLGALGGWERILPCIG